MQNHPAITAFLASLTPAEAREWRTRAVENEDDEKSMPPLSPELREKFETACAAILGHLPERAV